MSFNTLPQPGFGTFRLKDEVVRKAIGDALDLGYRHIDTAQVYDNESDVGQAIANSPVAREDIFLTTKVWMDYYRKADFQNSVKDSLKRLQTDYVDLLLCHWPSPDNEVPMAEYLGELKAAQEAGLTRHIGVSNFTNAQLDEAISILGPDVLLTNQVEVHPFLPNRSVVEHGKAHGLTITGYMPLAVGAVNDDPTLQAIGEAHGITAAQVSLAWVNQQGIVTIPSSTKRHHIESNLKAFDVRLSDDEMARIDALARGQRIANPDFAPAWD